MAKKLQSSLAVEGELPEDGLAAFGDDGDDMMMALARKIVSGEEEDGEAETVEEVFAQARNAEATAEELLVDDGWKIDGDREGDHRGQWQRSPRQWQRTSRCYRHRADGGAGSDQRPQGQPGTVNAAVTVNGNGNGHHDEAAEPQQSLFSWAEFMAEEPVKPKNRKSKPQPASLSMFEWALEQEREKEPVGAGS